MKTSFKQFLLKEEAIEQQAVVLAQKLLKDKIRDEIRAKPFSKREYSPDGERIDMKSVDSLNFTSSHYIDDHLIDTAKIVANKLISSAAGPWIINVFKVAERLFARVDPPKGTEVKQTYFFLRKPNNVNARTIKTTRIN